MHTSIRRWRTLQAQGWEWRHRQRYLQAWRRWLPWERSTGVAVAGLAEESEPEEVREPWRLWIARPDKIRTEFNVEDETVTAVIVGDTWWSWSTLEIVTTNAGDRDHYHGTGPGHELIDPALILPAVELEIGEDDVFVGRTVRNVIATPSPTDENDEESSDWHTATHGLGPGADDYLLTVDAERGVLLRSEARIGGEPFRVLEMEAVAFDEDFVPATFAPPQGSHVVRAPRR